MHWEVWGDLVTMGSHSLHILTKGPHLLGRHTTLTSWLLEGAEVGSGAEHGPALTSAGRHQDSGGGDWSRGQSLPLPAEQHCHRNGRPDS